ncbi:hypothetical protein PUW79_07960 [Microbacterium sp. NE2HP2]|uniref:hypothetical protein n=1 Tax=Microbacterium plantarum TaxID=1816425 RepID=UPI002366D564|nr:hypothetical protein [Microbacterium plantarum]MDD7944562.1 hypothetical protein [Microbacterium plantarum]
MTLKDEVNELLERARQTIASKTPPAGVMPRRSEPDMRWVIVNATNEAVVSALLKIAGRVDALENRS